MNKYIDTEEYTTAPDTPMVRTFKKITKHKIDKNRNYKIVNVQFPEILPPGSKLKAKYKIRLAYKGEDSRLHERTIFFGHRDRIDYVDHKVDRLRDNFIKNAKLPDGNKTPEFEPSFWDIFLLNSKEPDFFVSFQTLRQKIIS